MTGAASPEEVDVAVALAALQRLLAEHCRRVIAGEPVRWAGLAMLLEASARHCYDQAEPPA